MAGIDIKLELPPDGFELRLRNAIRQALLDAGREILAVSDILAPREPVPRHGVHMTETGFVALEPGVENDSVRIGYEAFWAIWQEENLEYHHPDGGQAKFLTTALLRSREVILEQIDAAIARALL